MKIPLLVAAGLLNLQPGPAANAPQLANEQLRYTVNWPSGLSLGEVSLRATRVKTSDEAPPRVQLEFDLDAAVPGFQVSDRFRSSASTEFCSAEFDKNTQHGKKKVEEKTLFDAEKRTASRETKDGGKSELKTGACGRDALAFLYFLRRELAEGRLPPSQTIFFGSPYEIHAEYKGTQTITLQDGAVQADRLAVSLKGPQSNVNFEAFFLKDAKRTPALVRVPLSMGTITMELVREP